MNLNDSPSKINEVFFVCVRLIEWMWGFFCHAEL